MSKRLALTTILFTIFLDFFNLGLIYPIFSSLIFEGHSRLLSAAPSEFLKNTVFGILIATFPFGQLFGAPIIGHMSDQYGRKKLLVFSLIGTVVTLLLCALGVFLSSLSILLVGRFFGGLMAGNMTIAFASLADLSGQHDKVRNFALIPLTTSAGFALAPLLAGFLANPETASWTGPTVPFLVATLFAVINLSMVITKFPETFAQNKERKPFNRIYSGLTNLSRIFKPCRERPYLWILFLMISANFLFVQFIGPYGAEKFGLDVTGIGYLYTNVGLGAALGNLFLTRGLAKYFSSEKALAGGLIALAILLVALIFTSGLISLHIVSFLIMLACAVGYTNSMALVSNLGGKDNQGEIMGIAVAIQNCSEFLPAFLVGFVAAFSENIPMLVAAVCAICCYVILRPIKENIQSVK